MDDRYIVMVGNQFQASYNFQLGKSLAFSYADWTARVTDGVVYEQLNNGPYKEVKNHGPAKRN